MIFKLIVLTNKTDQIQEKFDAIVIPKTIFFRAYFVLVSIFESAILIIMLLAFNIISLFKLKILIKTQRVTRNENHFKLIKIKITRLIIFLTFICLVTRTLDFIISTILRVWRLLNKCNSDKKEIEASLLLLRTISFLLIILAHALDSIFYYFGVSLLKAVAIDYKRKISIYFYCRE